MCGLVGLWSTSSTSMDSQEKTVQIMTQMLTHRGPDDFGSWSDLSNGLYLGHRRLSIRDLSPSGHQPMVSSSGRFVIVFNGEIYNHQELRRQLESTRNAPIWRGQSDTETLLALLENWGLDKSLSSFVGMFAFALWDKKDNSLVLVRDRLGEKPLYYGWSDGVFIFGSELKSLRAIPGFKNPVCSQALAQYVQCMCVPAPFSIYQGVFKLEPGCWLRVTGQPPAIPPSEPILPGHSYDTVKLERWWTFPWLVSRSTGSMLKSDSDKVDELEAHLIESVRLHSLADVPVGAFLSGGIDSSIIVALMQRQAVRPVKTFTIGFDENGFDESPHASAMARYLGTDHHEMRVSAQMAREVIPSLPWMYDEPFADSSQIPTYIVCKLARQHVTVVLSGDGGDELFGGYYRYIWGPKLWGRLAWLPFPLRWMLAKAIGAIPISGLNVLSSPAGVSRLGDKMHRFATRLGSVKSLDDICHSMVTECNDQEKLVKGVANSSLLTRIRNETLLTGLDPVERMMIWDTITYLPNDILCKLDRASMACGLEARAPFLDYRIVELAWRLPMNMKIRGETSKWGLRQVLYKYIPKEFIDRPKMGFAVPIGQWLRGPLRDWAEELLDEARLNRDGYFYAKPIRQAWLEHLTGRRDNSSKIWTILMFQAWLRETSSRVRA
jgi:asparagine synthase (glutamine-hydrolysing)